MIHRLRCLLGRHDWARFENPELAETGEPYLVCSRCGKDRPVHEKLSQGGSTGMGAAGGF